MRYASKGFKWVLKSVAPFALLYIALMCGPVFADVARVRAFLDAAEPDSTGPMIRLKAATIDTASEAPRMNTIIAWTNAMLTGSGQIVAVADTGLDTGDLNDMHPDFLNRIHAAFSWGKEGWDDTIGYGTHCAGSVLGNGAGYSDGLFRGSAWEASLVVQCIADTNNNLILPDDLQYLFRQAYANDARIHSDSWGMSI